MDYYGKVDPYQQREVEVSRKIRKKWCLLGVVGILLVVAAVIGLAVELSKHKNVNNGTQSTAANAMIVDVCKNTDYPDTCVSSLSAYAQGSPPSNPKAVIKLSFQIAIIELGRAVELVNNLTQAEGNSSLATIFTDCKENLVASIQQMNLSGIQFSNISLQNVQSELDDITTSLSSSLTLHSTCVDDILENLTDNSTDQIRAGGSYVSQLLSNALALFSVLTSAASGLPAIPTRRLLSDQSNEETEDQDPSPIYELTENGYPTWLSTESRKLLQANPSFKPNVIVAKDGSGKFKSVQAAVDAAPSHGGRYVIYVKSGFYWEVVRIPSGNTNLVIVGDGIGKTIIANNLNVQMKGMTTFQSATVAIAATRVILIGLTIQNVAGAPAHQAVALRVSNDLVVVYKCALQGNQDTLYAHVGRQFYRESIISGTVDFMFGNAAAVFQSCTLLAQKPILGQQVTYTAQGRMYKYQNTGFAFQFCNLVGSTALQRTINVAPVYLGRPWKLYSRTVYIKCNLSFIINPQGWLIWIGDFALSTLFYGEFQNVGAGAGVAHRVSWSTQMTAKQAHLYDVVSFISGANWIPLTGTPFLARAG